MPYLSEIHKELSYFYFFFKHFILLAHIDGVYNTDIKDFFVMQI